MSKRGPPYGPLLFDQDALPGIEKAGNMRCVVNAGFLSEEAFGFISLAI